MTEPSHAEMIKITNKNTHGNYVKLVQGPSLLKQNTLARKLRSRPVLKFQKWGGWVGGGFFYSQWGTQCSL